MNARDLFAFARVRVFRLKNWQLFKQHAFHVGGELPVVGFSKSFEAFKIGVIKSQSNLFWHSLPLVQKDFNGCTEIVFDSFDIFGITSFVTTKQYGVRLPDEIDRLLVEEAKRKYSNPSATLRKCAMLILPCLANGIPESTFEDMAGRRKARR